MAIRSEQLSSLEEQDFVQGEDQQNNHAPPYHHPSAPTDELFDISTTVDPGYIISLIRKLLPRDIRDSPHGVSTCDGSIKESKSGDMEECTASPLEDKASKSPNNKIDAMDVIGVLDNHGHPEEKDFSNENPTVSAGNETWEECGCILWDLSISKTHAEFMVENFVLEVLSANLVVSQSSRVKEICLGIIGNLACHEAPRKQIAAAEGLIQIIVDQLFLDDIPSLCEACR